MRIMLLALPLLIFAQDASARTAEQTALSSARKRGYTQAQTRCFVPVFAQYASLNRNGRWVASSRTRRGDAYRHEVWSRCGVMR